MQDRDIAIFSDNETIGFEEIYQIKTVDMMREWREVARKKNNVAVLEKLKKYNLDEAQSGEYSYTAVVKSFKAKLLYLSRENFENYSRYIGVKH